MRAACIAACAFALAAACGDEDGTGGDVAGDLVLTPAPAALAVAPGERNQVAFRLQDKNGRPRAGRLVTLALLPPEAPDNQTTGGATLLHSQGTTDATGSVLAEFRAGGQGVFRLRASHGRVANAIVPVVVADVTTRKAEALAIPEVGLSLASLEMRLYPDADCSGLTVTSPAPGDLALSQKLPAGGRWALPPLEVSRRYALTASGRDQSGLVIAFGCMTVAADTLLQSLPVTLSLPLRRVPPAVVGRFQLASELAFSPELAPGAKNAIAAWSRLTACPHDPASIWLDCTLDALTGSANDPLDCRPALDEGAVGQLIAARLGVPVAAGSECRGARDAGGENSLDNLALALFPPAGGSSHIINSLPKVTAEIAGLFDRIRLSSALEFAETGRPRSLQATHAVTGIGFPVGETFQNVSLLDRPGRFARFVVATLDEAGQQVELAQHGFGLRIGRAARMAFTTRALAERGLPSDEPAFVAAVFSNARLASEGGLRSGCDALDLLVCRDVGRAAGCVKEACEAGLATLAARLRAGFDGLDGEDLDVYLSGDAALSDRTDDGTIRSLGSLLANRAGPGLWSGELRTRAGTTALSGLWVGTRALGM